MFVIFDQSWLLSFKSILSILSCFVLFGGVLLKIDRFKFLLTFAYGQSRTLTSVTHNLSSLPGIPSLKRISTHKCFQRFFLHLKENNDF